MHHLKKLLITTSVICLIPAMAVSAQKAQPVKAQAEKVVKKGTITHASLVRLVRIKRTALGSSKNPIRKKNVNKADLRLLNIIRAMPKKRYNKLFGPKKLSAMDRVIFMNLRATKRHQMKKIYDFYGVPYPARPRRPIPATPTPAEPTPATPTPSGPILSGPIGMSPIMPNTRGYVLTHEHPVGALSFGGNYAFTGSINNFINGVMENGYTAACGGCTGVDGASDPCSHAEMSGIITAGNFGADMGNHASHVGPKVDAFSHIRYSTQWIRDAHRPPQPAFRDSRMRIMVAFALENETLCELLQRDNIGGGGPGGNGHSCTPGDSILSLERQIQATKDWAAANSDFMEIAYTASDARRIVLADKLAIIIGVEADYTFGAENKTFDPVNRLNRLYNKGVRTFYMAHKVNSRLAGADVYMPKQTMKGKALRANQAIQACFYYKDGSQRFPLRRRLNNIDRALSGNVFHEYCNNASVCGNDRSIKGFGVLNPNCHTRAGQITEVNMANYVLMGANEFNGFDVYPSPPGFSGSGGTTGGGSSSALTVSSSIERNNLGLSTDGERVVRAAMRKGMIMNLDHVSSKSRREMRVISDDFNDYPLNALHNRPNTMLAGRYDLPLGSDNDTPFPHEYDFDDTELEMISETGGFFGAILTPVDAQEGRESSGITQDCPQSITENGKILAYLIEKGLNVGYSLDFASVTQGLHSRSFEGCMPAGQTDIMDNYGNDHDTDGLSHIGMMKKFHKELENVGMRQDYVDQLKNDGVESFLQMWEASEAKASTLQMTTGTMIRVQQ